MNKHLQVHEDEYKAYLKALKVFNESKVEKLKEKRDLQEEVIQSQHDIQDAEGIQMATRHRPLTTPITKYFSKGGVVKYRPDSDMQRRAELDIATYIVTSNLSFNHIETPEFRRFVLSMNPKANVRSRSALTKTIIPLLHRNLKESMERLLQEHLPKIPAAGFTMDMWSSKGQKSYLSLTMHIVDGKWRLLNLLMACRHIEEASHTGELIADKAEKMLEEIPLPDDCHVAFTTDGAKSMVKAMRESPSVNEHLICFCHTISLCLQDAFSIPMIKEAVDILKELAGATHRSIKRITAIRRICNELDIPFVRIILPVATRWNSVVMCMKTVVRISPALKKLREEDLAYFEGIIPSDRQLDSFAQMLNPLTMIKQTSEMLEAEKKPTIHLVLPLMIKLSTISKSSKFQTSSKTTKAVIEAFEQGLASRIKDNGRAIQAVRFANFLHPSFKGSLLNVLDKDYYDQTVEEIKSLFPEVNPDSQDTAAEESQSVLDDPPEVVEEGWDDGFEGLRHEAQSSASQSVSQASGAELTSIEKELEVWNQVIQGPKKKEIDIDILAFWKKTEPTLPLLSWLARRVLCIPASSTSSERAFSTGGKVVSASRTLLNAEMSEDLIWMKKNFATLDPLVGRYILRMSEYRKKDKERLKEANKDKEKEKQPEETPVSDTSESESELSEAGYKSDLSEGVISVQDSDDE